MSVTETKTSARTLLKEFISDMYDSEDEVTNDELIRKAKKAFNGDAEFMTLLLEEAYKLLVPMVAAEVRHSRRHWHVESSETKERWSKVFEHVGEGRQRSLLTMTRPQHLSVAQEYDDRATQNIKMANFHRAIADLHTDDKTPTGERISTVRLDQLYRRHILGVDEARPTS